MPTADLLRPSRKPQDDEIQDHTESGAATKPGAARPRPDFDDKPLPGLVGSYIGQVCDSLRLHSKSTAHSASPAPTRKFLEEK